MEGYHVKPWEDPAFIPVLIHRKWWATLTADGMYNEVAPPVRELE